MAKKKVRKIQYPNKNKMAFSILATVGVVAVWRGIWIVFDALPYFERPIVAGGIAILILIIAGIYFKKIDFW